MAQLTGKWKNVDQTHLLALARGKLELQKVGGTTSVQGLTPSKVVLV